MAVSSVQPYADLTFDADGDPDPGQRAALLDQVTGLTDLVVFSHGWNNDLSTANTLYDRFFAPFPGLLAATPDARFGYAGVHWPSMRFSDEPIPDFPGAPPTDSGKGAGFAGSGAASADPCGNPGAGTGPSAGRSARPRPPAGASSALDSATIAALGRVFPGRAPEIARIAELLATRPGAPERLTEFAALVRVVTGAGAGFSTGFGGNAAAGFGTGVGPGLGTGIGPGFGTGSRPGFVPGFGPGSAAHGGERAGGVSAGVGMGGVQESVPGGSMGDVMGDDLDGGAEGGPGSESGAGPLILGGDPVAACRVLADALARAGARVTEPEPGEALFGGLGRRVWDGARELLRQATYFAMKRRAGAVGQLGLGPVLGQVARRAPAVRVHLVGHSFGARLAAFALRGLPPGTRVASVTLLQGAFSHYAFCGPLPFDAKGGALRGMQRRVSGPVVASHSRHDRALGVFYPLASRCSGEDTSLLGLGDRWGALGHDGFQRLGGVPALSLADALGGALPAAGCVSVDVSAVVRSGGPPSGAHSDICHEELARLVLRAAGRAPG